MSSLSINQWAGEKIWLNVSLYLFFVCLFYFFLSCCDFFSIGCYSETKKQFLRMVGFLLLRDSNLFLRKMIKCLRTCNLSLQNTVVPLLREKVMITQNVTLSNTQDGKIQKRNEFLILD